MLDTKEKLALEYDKAKFDCRSQESSHQGYIQMQNNRLLGIGTIDSSLIIAFLVLYLQKVITLFDYKIALFIILVPSLIIIVNQIRQRKKAILPILIARKKVNEAYDKLIKQKGAGVF